MKLPTEIFLQVLQNLRNRDLKVVRLASKHFSACAAEFLFRKMYISKQKEDLDAFEAFTNHPLIRKCVKTLEYDAVGLPADFSETSYYERLWYQVATMLPHSEHHEPFSSPDPQINQFVSHCRNAPSTATDSPIRFEERKRYIAQHQEEFMELAFIKRGYRKWMERATFERLHMQDQDFLGVLIPGLQKLDHLDSVSLNGEWCYVWHLGDTPTRGFYGSLLQRKWNPLIVLPLNWHYHYADPSYNSAGRFWTITTALSMASKQPRVFRCKAEMSPSAFFITGEHSHPDDCMVACASRVITCLERLSLCIRRYLSFSNHPHELESHEKLTGLQEMLKHVQRLRTLEVNLLWADRRRSLRVRGAIKKVIWKTFRYDLVFPISGKWESLTTISIGSFTIHLHELVELLFIKAPNLRRVHLDNIRLLEGTWQAMIELFKYGLRSLDDFQIDEFTRLFHCQQINVLVPWETQDVFAELKNYILNGCDNLNLRHPCLRPEEPIQKSLEYLPELLRECERKGRQGALAAKVVQSQIDYSTRAYQQWKLLNPEETVDEQA